MNRKIVNRWNGNVIWEGEADTALLALYAAIRSGADLSGADLSGEEVPVIPDLDQKILAAIESGGSLEMSTWHTCDTTHCRAGWAIHLAGEPGRKLEQQFGSGVAGALIYNAAYPGRRIPNFFANNEDAMEDIKKSACVAGHR